MYKSYAVIGTQPSEGHCDYKCTYVSTHTAPPYHQVRCAGTVFTDSHGGGAMAPFGGFKQSGIGPVFGDGDIEAFTETQTVKVKLSKL